MRIVPLPSHELSQSMHRCIWVAQLEAGRLVTDAIKHHAAARRQKDKWPTAFDMNRQFKGRPYGLHSQTIQALLAQIVANVDATKARRRSESSSQKWLRYPYREKKFFPLYWPAQAVSYNAADGRLILPMGRGRKSLVFAMDLDFSPGAAKLVWKDGYELHIVRPMSSTPEAPPGNNHACVDLGEIHQAAVVTNTGKALVVSGRGIRTHKRLLNKQMGEIAPLRSRCKKGSKRHKRLMAARRRQSARAKGRIRDLRHKGIRRVIDFCVREGVGSLYVGDPRTVREIDCGRKHNQRIARWEMGKDIAYLKYRSANAAMTCSTGSERGTSSQCPSCGNRHKPSGRVWRCKKCGFHGHRDVVGGANMHEIGFNQKVTFPASVTYRRPGPVREAAGVNNPLPAKAPERRSRTDTSLASGRRVLLGSPLP